jgi:hypothetical protein
MKYRLFSEIIKLSEAKDWEDARKEWYLQEIFMDDEPQSCLCGHSPIIEICVIKNSKNAKTTIVGNCCITKFFGLPSNKLFSSIKKIRANITKSVSDKMILFAHEKKVINDWERGFYLDIIRKRNLSAKQMEIKKVINQKLIGIVRMGRNTKMKIIELSTQEYKELYGEKVEKVEKPKKEPKLRHQIIEVRPATKPAEVQRDGRIGRHFKKYSKSEVKILRQNRTLSPRQLTKLLPNRDIDSIKAKLYYLFGTSKPKKARRSNEKASKRMAYIGREIAKMMKNNKNLSRSEASKLASEKYKLEHIQVDGW